MVDASRWQASTTAWPPSVGNGDLNPKEQTRPHATPVKTVGVTIYFQGPETARIRVRIIGADYGSPLNKIAGSSEMAYLAPPVKEFDFLVSDVPAAGPLYLLAARVVAFRTPPVEQLSGAGSDVDYPSLAIGRDGSVWVAWSGYQDSADHLWLREFSGGKWSEPIKVNENPTEVGSCAVAVDGENRVWVVWSERIDSDWHLMSRCYERATWRQTRQISKEVGNHVFPCLTVDHQGNLYLAWQSFRGGASSIYFKALHGDVWQDEIKLSDAKKSPRSNDWSPAIAIDRSGTAWVAWDSYQTGSYNILLRPVKDGVPGELLRVTDSPRFHAHPSLAVDDQDRLWIAYDEADENWGKDVGYHFSGGTALYQSRTIRFAIRAGDQWLEPRADLRDALGRFSHGFIQLPRLLGDGKGGMWVLFRSRVDSKLAMTRFAAGAQWDLMASPLFGGHLVRAGDVSGEHRAAQPGKPFCSGDGC